MKIAVGCDHAGYNLKLEVVKHLESKGYEVKDYGTYVKEACDYSEYAELVAEAVINKAADKGILICGTGIGISIAANKVPGIRAAHCTDTFSAHSCRQHNDVNILALGERVTGAGLALDIIDSFLSTEFEGGRHAIRVNKIVNIEKKYNK
jgi:ribose 5-phosphate isomerase B